MDVFLTRELSYEELVKDTVVESLQGHEVRIVSAECLLKLKLAIDPPRDKDRLDINTLTKLVEQHDG